MGFTIDGQLYINLLEEKVKQLQKEAIDRHFDNHYAKKKSPVSDLLGVTGEEQVLADETFKAPRNLTSDSSLTTVIKGNQ